VESPRRPGDPPLLIAECQKIRSVLGWTPSRDSLATIIQDALKWEEKLSQAPQSA
jgi:UDP-glucose 4-epimerase